jgi:phosphodiesterase/alkaline phosphatase D-like protein
VPNIPYPGWPWSDTFLRSGSQGLVRSRFTTTYPNDEYTITAANDTLVVSIDGGAGVTITIPHGTITNTALVALLQANATLAAQCQIGGGDYCRLFIQTNTVGSGGSVSISGNAASMLFPTTSNSGGSAAVGSDWSPVTTGGAAGGTWTVSAANGIISPTGASNSTTIQREVWTRAYDAMAYAPEYFSQAKIPNGFTSANCGLTIKDSVAGSGYLGAMTNQSSGGDTLTIYTATSAGAFTVLGVYTATGNDFGCFNASGKWISGSYIRLRYQGATLYLDVSQAADGVNFTNVLSAADTSWLEVRGLPGFRAKGTMNSGIKNWTCGPISGLISLQHIPLLGRPGSYSQAITIAADQACNAVVVYDTVSPPAANSTPSLSLTSATNFMGTVDLKGLQPGTLYYYDVQLNGVSKSNGLYNSFTTLPAPSVKGQQLTVAYGSCQCRSVGTGLDVIYNAIAAKNPSFFIHLGDLVYQDFSFVGLPSSYAEPPLMTQQAYRVKTRTLHAIGDANFSSPAVYTKFPSLFISDDHDFRNDYSDGRYALEYSAAEGPWRELVGNGNRNNTEAGETYYSFAHGDIGFFVMDQRAYRDPNTNDDICVSNNALAGSSVPSTWTVTSTSNKLYINIDGAAYTVTLTTGAQTAAQIVASINAVIPGSVGGAMVGSLGCIYIISNKPGGGTVQLSAGTNSAHTLLSLDTRLHQAGKTCLGANQKAQLKSWLLRNNTSLRVKVLISETTWSNYGTTPADSFGEGFIGERNELLDFIINNGIKGVVILSGDQHWSGVFKLYRYPNQTPGAGTFCLYEAMSSPLNNAMRALPTAGGDPQSQIVSMQTTNNNFGLCTIDTTVTPATVALAIYGPSGSLLTGQSGAGTSGVNQSISLTETQLNNGLSTPSTFMPVGS